MRSWLKSINNTRFSQSLYYNTGRSGSTTPVCWNGDISSMEWSLDGTVSSYDYKYDKLHRLTDAKYDDGSGYTEAFMTNYGYDKNGNIDGIMRQAITMDYEVAPLDEMVLYYTGTSSGASLISPVLTTSRITPHIRCQIQTTPIPTTRTATRRKIWTVIFCQFNIIC